MRTILVRALLRLSCCWCSSGWSPAGRAGSTSDIARRFPDWLDGVEVHIMLPFRVIVIVDGTRAKSLLVPFDRVTPRRGGDRTPGRSARQRPPCDRCCPGRHCRARPHRSGVSACSTPFSPTVRGVLRQRGSGDRTVTLESEIATVLAAVSFERTPLLRSASRWPRSRRSVQQEYDRLPHRWIVKYEKVVAARTRTDGDELADVMGK